MLHKPCCAIVAFTTFLLTTSTSHADLIFDLAAGTTITYTSPSVGGLPAGTYDIDGSLNIDFQSSTASTAMFQTNLYSISLDANSNGTFYDANDVIVETAPYTNIAVHAPSIGSTLGTTPATLTTMNDGTWELRGKIGAYSGPGLFGGDTNTNANIASGTFTGLFTNPTSFTFTRGYPGDTTPGELGPSLNSGLGTPNLTFNASAVPEPSSLVMLSLAGIGAVASRFRRRKIGK